MVMDDLTQRFLVDVLKRAKRTLSSVELIFNHLSLAFSVDTYPCSCNSLISELDKELQMAPEQHKAECSISFLEDSYLIDLLKSHPN